MQRISFVVYATLLVSQSLHAEVVYSNFGDGETFNSSVGKGVGSYDPPLIHAVPFSLSYPAVLDEIRVAVRNNQSSLPNVLNVAVCSSASDGNPGPSLETIPVADLPLSGFEVHSALSALHPQLAADEIYWIVLSGDGQFVWALTSLQRYGFKYSTDGGASWKEPGLSDPIVLRRQFAFSVAGRIVPEPSIAVLTCTTALVSFAAHRRRVKEN